MSDFLYEVDGHLARLTMNRPEHLNCFSEEMIHLWTAALEDIRDRDDIYAVLLSGNGKAFCAGGDVKAMAAGDGFFESHDDITSTALARKNSLWKGIQRIPLILEREDLGGLTGTVEVLDSQGYQSTIETGRLLQEDPGNGVLVLRFTAALSD